MRSRNRYGRYIRPIVKHSFMVKRAEDIPDDQEGLYIAATGCRGPVVIDIPGRHPPGRGVEYQYPPASKCAPTHCRPARSYRADQEGRRSCAALAKRRCHLRRRRRGAGRWAANCCDGWPGTGIYPVTNTLMGLGAYPATDRQFLGMLGMHGFTRQYGHAPPM